MDALGVVRTLLGSRLSPAEASVFLFDASEGDFSPAATTYSASAFSERLTLWVAAVEPLNGLAADIAGMFVWEVAPKPSSVCIVKGSELTCWLARFYQQLLRPCPPSHIEVRRMPQDCPMRKCEEV